MQTFATALTQGEKEAAIAGGIAGAAIGMISVFAIVFYILTVVATWKIFKKAGEPGWKCLIPIYNIYIMYKIVGMTNWFWILLGVSLLASIILSIDGTSNIYDMNSAEVAAVDWSKHPMSIIALLVDAVVCIWGAVLYANRTSKAFGHGIGFAIGLFLLPNLFWLILGFDHSKYDKKILKK